MKAPSATSMPLRALPLMGVGETMLLVVAAIWGSSYAIAKEATSYVPVLLFLALRFGLTFVLLLPALRPVLRLHDLRPLLRGIGLGLILLGIFLCETFGVTLTSASNAAFLISLCVALTPLMQWWLLDQRPSARMWGLAVLSVSGAGLIAFSSTAQLSIGWGDALMLLAALLRALMVCMTKRFANHHNLPALTLTALQAGTIAVCTSLLSVLLLDTDSIHLPQASAFWLNLLYLVVFCTIFAFFAQNYAASRTNPSRVSLLMGSEPIFGALFAMWWLHESLSPLGWLGGGLIVLSAWMVTVPEKGTMAA